MGKEGGAKECGAGYENLNHAPDSTTYKKQLDGMRECHAYSSIQGSPANQIQSLDHNRGPMNQNDEN